MCHYFGIGWFEIQRMPFSEFTRLAKCATMLSAKDRMLDINVTNFVHLKEDQKRTFHSSLVSASTEFIERRVKDYKEVLANVAKAMSGRR